MEYNNPNKPERTPLGRLPLAILALLCMVMTHLAAMADAEFYYNVGYPMDDSYWPLDESLDFHVDPMTSSYPIVGSYWTERGFSCIRSGYTQTICLMGGPKGASTETYIRNEDKITEPISGIMLKCRLKNDYVWKSLTGITLKVSRNKDLTNARTYSFAKPIEYSELLNVVFNIDVPMRDMYYSIEFDLGINNHSSILGSEGWFAVTEIRFALPESTEGMPIYHETTLPGNEGFKIDMEAYGNMQLHVMWGHYDSDENRIDYFYSTAQDANGYAAQSNEPDIIQTLSRSWKSNVSSPYSYTFKPDEGETYIFRAKSVSADDPNHQSNEIVKEISHDGIVTGIESVAAAAAVREELWFNMQGVRVASPRSPGVYIHVRDGKARKIVL